MTQLTQAAVRAAFEAQLEGFTAGGEINTESTPLYVPRAGVPYLSSRLSAYQRFPLGIGAPTAQAAQGSFQVNVNRPAVEGLVIAGKVAGRLVALFERGTTLTTPTGHVVTVMDASEQVAIAAGDWSTIPVTFSWYCTE